MERPDRLMNMLAVGGMALLWSACSQPCPPVPEPPPPPDMAALTTQVQAMEDAYAKAEMAKDVEGVMAYYAEDIVSHMHERPALSGKANLRERMAERMAKDSSGVTPTFKVEELFLGDDHMTEIGSWTETDANGEVVDHGTYFSIFRKNGDGWECIREIAVSAQPDDEDDMDE